MTKSTGHGQPLRDRFLRGSEDSRTDAVLLEFILTHPVPQQDVRPLAQRFLARFGRLERVLQAETSSQCEVDGINAQSATLLEPFNPAHYIS